MTTVRGGKLAIILACSSLLAGCADMDPMLARRTTVGSLKASVSQLEYDKDQLSKEVRELKAENRRVTNRLTQEEAANGELSARLDDARVLLRGQGYDTDGLASPTRPAGSVDEPSTAPSQRNPRRGHKPPFAQIPGRIDPAPSSDADEQDTDPFAAPTTGGQRDFGPQSRLEDPSRWHRVARMNGDLR
jgi:outer membrane murein-binding lipoprotein Lpp